MQLATPVDCDLVLPLMQAYYRADQLEFDVTRQGEALRRLLREPQWGRVWLIRWQGTTVGYVVVCFGFSLELAGNEAYLDELFVQPEARGHGLARHALQHLETELRALGICALHLEVDVRNATAQRVYSALGYGRRDRYFLMTRHLGSGN